MAIDFNLERWEKVRENYGLWWEGKLPRAIVKATVTNRLPSYPCPSTPYLSQANCHDFSVSPEDIIDRMDYSLSENTYLGDAFPYINMHSFGPGVVAAFCGARLDNSTGRVWFHAPEVQDIKDIHIEYDPNNKWLSRIKDIYAAGMRKWQGNVLMSMTDLGGVLDILATFRGSDNLLMDLYDYPEEVTRLCREIEEIWFRAYNDINEVIETTNPGYTDWSALYSEKRSYVLQSDFTYMVGPDMFKEFALPDLVDAVERLDNVIYHLDGAGELPHLDYLLGIDKLKAVQWVFGDGAPNAAYWIDSVYRKIQAAGKNIQVLGDFPNMREVKEALGGKGLYFSITDPNVLKDEKTAAEAVRILSAV